MPRSTKELDAEAKEIWEAKIHINHRRPKKYVEEEDTEVHGPVVKTPVQGGKNNWCFIIFLSVFICGIVTLRVLSGRCKLLPKSHSEESYDYDYDAFTKNYEILGLPATETVTQRQIKEAYTPLALKWHPDKNRGCAECKDKYLEIAQAYEALKTHHEAFWERFGTKAKTAEKKEI